MNDLPRLQRPGRAAAPASGPASAAALPEFRDEEEVLVLKGYLDGLLHLSRHDGAAAPTPGYLHGLRLGLAKAGQRAAVEAADRGGVPPQSPASRAAEAAAADRWLDHECLRGVLDALEGIGPPPMTASLPYQRGYQTGLGEVRRRR